MASQSFLKIGSYQYGGSQRWINDPQASLFNSTDLIADGRKGDGSLVRSYRITVSELRHRLETLGYTLEQVRQDVVSTLSKGYEEIDGYEQPYYRAFLDYGTKISIQDLLEMVRRSIQTDWPPIDFEFVNTTDFPRAMLDFISGGYAFLLPGERIFLTGHHFERLACEHFRDDEFFELDFSDLVEAGYIKPEERPLPDSYDESLALLNPIALRLGQTLVEEESETLEFKSVESADPAKTIAKHIPKYAIGFLNRSGGRILFGVTDEGTVEGIPINRAGRDELQRLINQACRKITPSFPPDGLTILFRPLIAVGRTIPDRVVVDITVPPGKANEMYFKESSNDEKDSETWVRVGSETRKYQGHQLFAHICARYGTADQLLIAMSQRYQIAKEEVERLRQEGEQHSGELSKKEAAMEEMQRIISETTKLLKQTDLICPECEAPIRDRHFHTIHSPDGEQDHDIEIIIYECGHDRVND